MKRKMKTIVCGVLAAAAAFSSSVSAFAVTPEFGRTAEEWAHLRDNTLEYYEIDDLIKEYNPTVIKNDHALTQYRRDYGDTNTEVSSAYTELADELESSMSYPDTSDMTYGTTMLAIMMNENTIKSLRSQADAALEDSEIQRLTYEMTEKSLALSARTNMISYYTGLIDEEIADLQVQLAADQQNVTQVKYSVGMATTVEVLNATESLQKAQAATITTRTNTENAKNRLITMCGWKYGAGAEIGALPEIDMARIAAMDPAADMEKALANNYTIRINERKLSNAASDSNKTTLNDTLAQNRQSVSIGLNAAYINVTASKSAYDSAVSAAALQNKLLATASAGYAQGTVSRVEYNAQVITARIAQLNVTKAGYALLSAMESYDYAVAGLAGTN